MDAWKGTSMKTIDDLTLKKQEAFLEAYRGLGNITVAAAKVGIARQTHYDWLKKFPEYAQDFKEAQLIAADVLEDEALRRAALGWEEPVFYQGEQVATVRKYSDTLLIFLLKGIKPEKYRDRTEHTGPGGFPMVGEICVRYVDGRREDAGDEKLE
jgi:transposase-like protein